MQEEKNIRISKVLKELNISLDRAIDYFKEIGIEVVSNINGKITQSEYEILHKKFDKFSKPREILYLEQFYKISLHPISKIEAILDFINNNSYFVNEKQQITGLNIRDNQIKNIKPLNGLTDLTKLNLSNNFITDIDALKGLIKLKDLALSYNLISDIKPLEELTALKILTLTETLKSQQKLKKILKPFKNKGLKELWVSPIWCIFVVLKYDIRVQNYK